MYVLVTQALTVIFMSSINEILGCFGVIKSGFGLCGAAGLASSSTLATKLGQGDAHGPVAVLRLAWGLLVAQSGPESANGAPEPVQLAISGTLIIVHHSLIVPIAAP